MKGLSKVNQFNRRIDIASFIAGVAMTILFLAVAAASLGDMFLGVMPGFSLAVSLLFTALALAFGEMSSYIYESILQYKKYL